MELQNYLGSDFESLKTVCFFHSAMMDNGKVLNGILSLIYKTGFLQNIDRLYLINLGPKIRVEDPKIKVINYSDDIKLYEFPTLQLLHIFSKFTNSKILYIHTKGTLHPNNSYVKDWKNMMLYFMIEEYKNCLDLLDRYDIVGCNYRTHPVKHYSGNFWWANSNYLSKNPCLIYFPDKYLVRYDCEFWLFKNPNHKYCDIHNDNFEGGNYRFPYPRSLYTNKSPIELDNYQRVTLLDIEKQLITDFKISITVVDFSNIINPNLVRNLKDFIGEKELIQVVNTWTPKMQEVTDLNFKVLFNGQEIPPANILSINSWSVYGNIRRLIAKYSHYVKKYIIIYGTTLDAQWGESLRKNHNIQFESSQSGHSEETIKKGIWPAIEDFLKENRNWELYARIMEGSGITVLNRIDSFVLKKIHENYPNLKITYGKDNKITDITDIVLSNFYFDGKIRLKSIRYNEYFGDPCFGTVKNLYIQNGDKNYVFKEDQDIEISIY